MKRQTQIAPGVFNYSTGQVGTSDLPAFIGEVCTRKPSLNKKQTRAYGRLTVPVVDKAGWRSQLAGAYAKLKQAAKGKH